jgi:hypothetical protein
MKPPVVITKVTGHIVIPVLARELRYLDETSPRVPQRLSPLAAEEIKIIIDPKRRGRNR